MTRARTQRGKKPAVRPKEPREHPLFLGRPAPALVQVQRITRDGRGRQSRALVSTRVDPWSIVDLDTLRARFGAGRFVLLPFSESGGIDGNSQTVDVPDDNGNVPLNPLPTEDQADAKGDAAPQGIDQAKQMMEWFKLQLQTVQTDAKRQVDEARENRKLDLEMVSDVLSKSGGGKDVFTEFLRDQVKTLQAKVDDLTKERDALREKQWKKGDGDGFMGDVFKQAAPELLTMLQRLNNKKPKGEGEGTNKRRERARVDASELPSAVELAEQLATGYELTDRDVSVFRTLLRAGRLSSDLAELLRPWLSEDGLRLAARTDAAPGGARDGAGGEGPLGRAGGETVPAGNTGRNGAGDSGPGAGAPLPAGPGLLG